VRGVKSAYKLVIVIFSLALLMVVSANAEEGGVLGSGSSEIDEAYHSAFVVGLGDFSPERRLAFFPDGFFLREALSAARDSKKDAPAEEVEQKNPFYANGFDMKDNGVYKESVPVPRKSGQSEVEGYTLSTPELAFKKFDLQEWLQTKNSEESTAFFAPVPFFGLPVSDNGAAHEPRLLSMDSMSIFWYINKRF